MTYTPIPPGTLNWDVPVNGAFTSQDSRITSNETTISALVGQTNANTASINAFRGAGSMPADYSLLNWSYDPSAMTNGQVPTSGTVLMVKMYLDTGTVNAVGTFVNAAGVTLTAGQNFMGLYNQAGTRIGVTADQTTSWGTVGYKQIPLVAPAAVTAGFYYVAFLSNGATPAGLVRNGNITSATSSVNLNLAADFARYASGPAAQTTLPTSVTMSARTPITMTYWMTAA